MNENLKALSYALRKNVLDMVYRAKTGHIGGDFSVMEILVSLYLKEMNISPENQDDPDRDYFVMSKGHSVEAYYSVLAAKGFLDIDDVIRNFSTFGSKYIGHPNNKLPGIEMNSGSLGHGLPVCVGIAKACQMDGRAASTRLWETESWRKVPSGKALWQLPSTIWITCAPWSTETGFRSPVPRRRSCTTTILRPVSRHLAGTS